MRKIQQKEIIQVSIATLALLGLTIFLLYRQATPEWRYYQNEFRYIVQEEIGEVNPDAIPKGIQQVWVEDLDRVDRCQTCHLGIGWKGLDRVEQPWKSHPKPELFEDHPIEKYGCTSCHGGQGWALTTHEAHGFVKHWEEPLLSKTIGSEYDPRTPPPLYEMNCNYCHRYERKTEGMPWINQAKDIVNKKACKVCHVINGSGGKLGPELTHEGDKGAEGYDFSNFVTDQMTVFNWHINHFQSPETVVPNSIMPDMNFQSKEAMALTMLMLSWKDMSDLPAEYIPGLEFKDEMTPEEIARDERMRSGDGAFFVENSCFICHSVKAFDIQSPTEKGPDLSYAPEDVRARFSRDLEEFIFDPTGTMKIIFESQIVLTDEQKWEAIDKIRKAYDIVKNRQNQNK